MAISSIEEAAAHVEELAEGVASAGAASGDGEPTSDIRYDPPHPPSEPPICTFSFTMSEPTGPITGQSTTAELVSASGKIKGSSFSVQDITVTFTFAQGTPQQTVKVLHGTIEEFGDGFAWKTGNASFKGLGEVKLRVHAVARWRNSLTGKEDIREATRTITMIFSDAHKPQVKITAPALVTSADSKGRFRVEFSATATDNVGVKNVVYRVNNSNNPSPMTLANGVWIPVTVPKLDYVAPPATQKIRVTAIDDSGLPGEATHVITTRDIAAPTLVVKPDDTISLPAREDGSALLPDLSGTAKDVVSGVASVQWVLDPPSNLDQASWKSANLQPASTTGVRAWSTGPVTIPAGGIHRIAVRATDNAGNRTDAVQRTIEVQPTYPPVDPTTHEYLKSLIDFVSARFTVSGMPVSPAQLRVQLHQPFAELFSLDPVTLQATAQRRESELRLVVEVMRHRFESNRVAYATMIAEQQPGAFPAKLADAVAKRQAADTQYRQRAYEAVLERLGASPAELRDALRADEAVQQALADRLGIELGGSATEPNNLQRLTLDAGQVTEASLEKLFGLAAFAVPGTPVLPVPAVPATLVGALQAERLDTVWRERDRDRPGAVADPDVITEADVKPSAIAALDLLRDRQEWLDGMLAWMRSQPTPKPGTGPTPVPVPEPEPIPGPPVEVVVVRAADPVDPKVNPPLLRFDLIVASVLGDMDRLLELAAKQRAGEDIEPALAAMELSPPAFARLMAIRGVVAEHTALLADWEDAYAILVHTAKVRAYPQWRAEEHAAGVILSPDFFVVGDAERTGALSTWRVVRGARRGWLVALQGRVEQRMNLRQALSSAIEAAERDAYPLLRDGIITALQPLAPQFAATTADALSKLLFVDVMTTGEVRLSRVDFAIQVLQALVLNVRTGTAGSWARKPSVEPEDKFDEELRWMGSYANWYAAMKVFLFPENMLYPALRPVAGAVAQSNGFKKTIADLRAERPLTSIRAGEIVGPFGVKLVRTPEDLKKHRTAAAAEIGTAKLGSIPVAVQERYHFLPLAVALQLHRSGQYLAALDWFRMVYAYDLPPAVRKTWPGLGMERDTSTVARKFRRKLVWLQDSLNPHDIVQESYKDMQTARYDVHTRFVVAAIARCLLDFADSEFVQDTNESLPRARSLYRLALDLLAQPELNPVPIPGLTPNDVPTALRRRAQVALAKLHTGRNAAGLVRQIEPITAVNAAAGSSPLVAGSSPFGSETVRSLQPTPYRYATLIERTKQLATIAQQVEHAYLAALEKRDAEAYNLLKARQDLGLANANIRLQALRATEAADGVTLAGLQLDRADTQVREYDALLAHPMNGYEDMLIDDYRSQRRAKDTIAGLDAAISSIQAVQSAVSENLVKTLLGGLSVGAVVGLTIGKADQTMRLNGIEADIQRHSLRASVENRVREWRMQQSVARKDFAIARQQSKLALDHEAIVAQEGAIAQLQLAHVQATLDFLTGKFTNVELYEWMIDVLADVYGYFLRQATSLGQFAQAQLAFEIQQAVPVFVRRDYWQPSEDGVLAGTAEPDRRGLTGSARLLRDIYELDQFAFENNKRKLQLTKTFSLARLAPVEFQEFRRTGVLTFATPMEAFDQDFPGHYLRLVRRVRTSVVALVPPNQGIKATLTNAGVSRVVIGGDSFQTVRLVRGVEQVALTSPADATGVFELDTQPELLLPFELSGVDSLWSLEMPKAANLFDYRTIADVLVTFEYTALASAEHRQKVIAQLDRTIGADRLFSLRDRFPDQWYDLHNPQVPAAPATIEFDVSGGDFPTHVDEVSTTQVALYVLFTDGTAGTPLQVSLALRPGGGVKPVGGTSTSTSGGIVSTRLGNGAPWTPVLNQAPFGRWRITFPETAKMRQLLESDAIEDIALVLSYTGRTPSWPA